MVRTFDRYEVEPQLRAALLNRFTALGSPKIVAVEAIGLIRLWKKGGRVLVRGYARKPICVIKSIVDDDKIQHHCVQFLILKTYRYYALVAAHFPRKFPSHFMQDFDHCSSREVDHVIGAFFLVRRSVFEQLKGFDERYFVYLEDLDFSLRARKAGWKTYYLADATAYHKGGGTSEQVKAHRLFYSLRSRMIYGFRHFNLSAAWGLSC